MARPMTGICYRLGSLLCIFMHGLLFLWFCVVVAQKYRFRPNTSMLALTEFLRCYAILQSLSLLTYCCWVK